MSEEIVVEASNIFQFGIGLVAANVLWCRYAPPEFSWGLSLLVGTPLGLLATVVLALVVPP